ncbi:discoidin domain-containing protein [Streptomyces sp. NPDC058424]|uniref:glycosyl hydrolase family 95 catalytic domain-containing protein n=1 Tax=Streptomyces sp. NPDC058424 TaxID=3346491 RepID=UPI003649C180
MRRHITVISAFAMVGALTAVPALAADVGPSNADGFKVPQAVLDHLGQDDWAKLQKILSGISGSVTSPLKISDVDKGSYTTGQLMGNGDIGAVAAGVSDTSQQYYFGKNDFFGKLHAQGSSVKDNDGILSGGGLDVWPTTAAGTNAASAFEMKQDILNAQVTTDLELKDDHGADAPIRLNSWTADTANVFVTEIRNNGTGPVTLRTKQWVPAMAYANSSATDLTDAQNTYPYTGGVDSSQASPVLWTTRDSSTTNTSGYRSRMATATTVVGAALANPREEIEANDYYDSNKKKYYNSLGESGNVTVAPGATASLVTYLTSNSGNYTKIKSVRDVQKDAVDGVRSYASQSAVDQLKAEHQAWWKNYWLRSYVQFADPEVAQYYYGSLYVLGSSNRPTSANGKVNPQNLPGSMYGEWVPADNVGWGGRYFLNYNQQAQYYASGSINRIDTEVPFNRVIAYDLPWQQNNAAAQGHDGAVHVRTLSPFHLLASDQPALNSKAPVPVYGFSSGSTDQKSNGFFAAINMLSYYEYTLDDQYLRKVLYPHLKQLLDFYSSYVLKQDDGNGQYHYSVIGSSIHEGDAADINPDLDIGAIKYLSKFLSAHAKEMGEASATVARWKDLADHTAFPEAGLPKGIFSANNNDNFVPTLMATDYQSPNQAHVDMIEPGDQPVELEGVVFPFENAQQLDGDPELLGKVRNTLEYMNSWAATGFAGWSSQNNGFPKVFPIAAHAGWPAADLLAKFKTALKAKVRTSNLTYYGSGGAVETVGAMEGVNAMLLQSSTTPDLPTTLSVFPNWDRTQSVSYERLGAKGNVEVSSAFDADKRSVSYVDVTSKRDGKIALVDPWASGRPVIQMVNADNTLGERVDYDVQGGKLVFNTKQGRRYMVMVDTTDQTHTVTGISLSKYSTTLVYDSANRNAPAGTGTVTATLEGGKPGDTVEWKSSNNQVVKVTGTGNTATIQAVGTGGGKVANATITARSVEQGGLSDNGVSQTINVKVADVSTVPTGLQLLSPSEATIYGPASTSASTGKVTGTNRLQLTASVSPVNAYDRRIAWRSSDQNVAMVDKNGLVIARGTGMVTITGTSMANPSLPPVTTTVKVTSPGADFSKYSPLASVLAAAKNVSAYSGDTTGGGGFKRVSTNRDWEGLQERLQMAYINALGVKARYSGYSAVNISKDTAYFAAIALNEAIKAIDPALAITLPDKTDLVAAIANASKLTADDFATPKAWDDLQAALAAARKVNDDTQATQADVDAAYAALASAASAVKSGDVSDVPKADLSGVSTVTVRGGHLVQLVAGTGRTWTVTAADGSAAPDATIDPSGGLLMVTGNGAYQVTAKAPDAADVVVTVTFTDVPAPLRNLSLNDNGNGTAFGSTSGGSYPPRNAFDDNPGTFYDHSSTTPYVGWDFGSPTPVNVLRFLPRSGTNAARIAGAKLQGSNTSDSDGFVDLVTIDDSPATANSSSWYVKALNNNTAYRYYRWLGTSTSHANVASMELYAANDRQVTVTTTPAN